MNAAERIMKASSAVLMSDTDVESLDLTSTTMLDFHLQIQDITSHIQIYKDQTNVHCKHTFLEILCPNKYIKLHFDRLADSEIEHNLLQIHPYY